MRLSTYHGPFSFLSDKFSLTTITFNLWVLLNTSISDTGFPPFCIIYFSSVRIISL